MKTQKLTLKRRQEKRKAMSIMVVIFSFIFLSSLSFSSALPDDSGNRIDFTYETPINYSLIPTVNNSIFLQGLTPQQVADLFVELDPKAYNGTLAYNSSLSNYYLLSNPFGFYNSTNNDKYTDAEAVSAVATADDYLKNTGDTSTGNYNFGSGWIQTTSTIQSGPMTNTRMTTTDGSIVVQGTTTQGISFWRGGTKMGSITTSSNRLTINGEDGAGVAIGKSVDNSAQTPYDATPQLLVWNEDSTDGVHTVLRMALYGGEHALIDAKRTADNVVDLSFGTRTSSAGYTEFVNFGIDASNVKTTDLSTDLVYTGAGTGVPFANIHGTNIAWTQVSAGQNVWYNIVDSSMGDGELNLATHDGNGKLTLTKAGRYLINYAVTWEANVSNVHTEFGIEVNSAGGCTTNIQAESHSADVREQSSGNTILSLSAGQTIELSMRTTDAGSPTLSIDSIQLTATMVGG